MQTCSTLSVLLVPVVAGADIASVVQVPTKGMTQGRCTEPDGPMTRRSRSFTSCGVRLSESVVSSPAGSVQQSVTRMGDTPSQMKEYERVATVVVSCCSNIRGMAGLVCKPVSSPAAAMPLISPQP